jgi:hypothetical protein
MSAIIDNPGFYSSKAGKCEVEYVGKTWAYGNVGGQVQVWTLDGTAIKFPWHGLKHSQDWAITSAYVEPRKPVEAYAVITSDEDGHFFRLSKSAAESTALSLERTGVTCRIIHLREYEDS